MDKKSKKNIFLKLLVLIFIFFLIVYLSKEAGFYEYKMYNKAKLTQEAINKFEKDIDDGKNVSIEEYIIKDNIDYSNTFSNIGSSVGNLIENFMNNGLKKTLKVLSELFYE